MSEETRMTFTNIKILDFDADGVELIAGADNMVEVPYILSDKPPEEWTRYFLSRVGYKEARVVADRAIYKCRKDVAAIKRQGECWNIVAKYVEDSNRHFREIEAEQQREQTRGQEVQRQDELRQIEFEEWKRNLKRHH
jgi:hypothetical protein